MYGAKHEDNNREKEIDLLFSVARLLAFREEEEYFLWESIFLCQFCLLYDDKANILFSLSLSFLLIAITTYKP
jgi:hypothetical protein